MKPREKALLAVFCTLFGLLVGGGLLMLTLRSWRSVREENEQLRLRVASLQGTIAQGSQWRERSAWVQEHLPGFASHEEASARLLETVMQQADVSALKLQGKEFVKPVAPAEGAESATFCDRASVRVKLANVQEQALFTWLHTLLQPELFVGITSFQMETGEGKTVSCEVEITQFYRQSQPETADLGKGKGT